MMIMQLKNQMDVFARGTVSQYLVADTVYRLIWINRLIDVQGDGEISLMASWRRHKLEILVTVSVRVPISVIKPPG